VRVAPCHSNCGPNCGPIRPARRVRQLQLLQDMAVRSKPVSKRFKSSSSRPGGSPRPGAHSRFCEPDCTSNARW
jgi:hypothetical protein